MDILAFLLRKRLSDAIGMTATAQVGPTTTIAYGMRANEPAFSSLVAAIGAFAATTFSPSDPNAQATYQALSASVQAALAGQPGAQTVNDVAADLANAQTTIKDAGTVNTQLPPWMLALHAFVPF